MNTMLPRTALLSALTLLALAVPTAYAQERNAMMTQAPGISWDALLQKATSAETQINTINASVTLVVTCGKTGMVHAPGVGGADANGCIAPAVPGNVTTALNNVTTNANNESITVANILNCNASGQLYNASAGKCISALSPASVVKIQASSQAISGNGKYASYALASCPTGTTLIACMGARNPSITDTCDESQCGYIGTGPVNSTTCMTTVDDDKGTRATAWATCLKTN